MRKIDQSTDVTLFIEDRGWLGAGLATLACVGCGVIFYIVWAVDAQMGGALRAAIGLACGIGAFIFIRLVLRTETRRIEIDRAKGLVRVRLWRLSGRAGWSAAIGDVQDLKIARAAGSDGDWFEVTLHFKDRAPLIFCQTSDAAEADRTRLAMRATLEGATVQ